MVVPFRTLSHLCLPDQAVGLSALLAAGDAGALPDHPHVPGQDLLASVDGDGGALAGQQTQLAFVTLGGDGEQS